MGRAGWIWLVCVFGACGGHAGMVPAAPRASAPALRIARAEARRAGGVAELVALAGAGPIEDRLRALRGLGRIGSPPARAALIGALGDRDAAVRRAAAEGLWLAGDGGDEAAVLAALARERDPDARIALVRALGRVGSAAAEPALLAAATGGGAEVDAALIAFGVLGRREIELVPDVARALLAPIAGHEWARIYAWHRSKVSFALAGAEAEAAMVESLEAASGDEAPLALGVLGRRGLGGPKALAALASGDVALEVEAVRALTGATSTVADRAALVDWLDLRARDLTRQASVLREVLTGLAAHASDPKVVEIADGLAAWIFADISDIRRGSFVAHDNLMCLGSGLARLTDPAPTKHAFIEDLDAMCRHAFAPLAGEVRAAAIADGTAPPAERAAALVARAAAGDPNDRAAAFARLGELPHTDGEDAALVAALADPALAVSGSAAELCATRAKAGPLAADLATAILRRAERAAGRAAEIELETSLVAALAARKLAAAAPLCRRLAGDPNRTVAAAGDACLVALGQAQVEPAPDQVSPAPPVDPATVIGKRVTWHVTTSRGELDLELEPDVAPWHVAMIVALTRAGFYDHLPFHRVVPGFVVQGGDPDGTGWGGPGYVVPAEPSGLPYLRGTVGIADAGLDTGGSQWFIALGRQPHLEGRYTIVGRVVRGLELLDLLQPGDRIERARVDLE